MKVKVFAFIVCLCVATVVGWIAFSDVFLPVQYVMFSDEDVPAEVPLSNLSDWEKTVKSWDWVSQYKIQWRPPAMLQVQLIPRIAIASYGQGTYIDMRGDVFHARAEIDNLPVLNVREHEIKSALTLIEQLNSDKRVSTLNSFPSGSIEVKFEDGDELVLPSFSLDYVWKQGFETMKKDTTQPVRCDLRHISYLSCEKRQSQ